MDSARAKGAQAYLDARGLRVLATLDAIAAAHRTSVAAVSLAWLLSRANVAAPIASARTQQQLVELLQAGALELGEDEIAALSDVSDG